MISPTTFAQTSFYDIGGHGLYFAMITAHFCLFIDESPLQKYPVCTFNFVLSMLASASICSYAVDYFTFSSFTSEILIGLGVALISSIAFTMSLQRIFNVQWNL